VFQYLGTIERPRQIAFADADGRVVYDFRERGTVGPHAGSDAGAVRLKPDPTSVIYTWERLMLQAAGR
jgi:hypothetical protein